MKKALALFLAFRMIIDVRRGKIAHYIRGSILGVGLSIIPLIVVLEVSSGMIQGITNRFLEVGTYHLQIRFWEEPPMESISLIAANLRLQENVKHVSVERQGRGLIYAGSKRFGAIVRAVPPGLYRSDEGFRRYFAMTAGDFLIGDEGGILLGKGVAEALGIGIGETIRLLTTSESQNRTPTFKLVSYPVSGVFTTGYNELDQIWVFIDLEEGMDILKSRDADLIIGIKITDPYADMTETITRIRSVLPRSAEVYSWYDLQFNRYKTFQTTRALLIFIMAMIVLVASVNISSSMVMIVLEKTQEIGILKNMGIQTSILKFSFLLTGFIVGVLGSILGISFGLFISVNVNELISFMERIINLGIQIAHSLFRQIMEIEETGPVVFFDAAYYLERVPIRIRFQELFVVSLFTSVLAVAASYVPASRAALLKPIDILRRY